MNWTICQIKNFSFKLVFYLLINDLYYPHQEQDDEKPEEPENYFIHLDFVNIYFPKEMLIVGIYGAG